MHRCAYTDAARVGYALQPCSDVDPVTKQIVTPDNNIAHIDPNSELKTTVIRYVCIAVRYFLLQLGRASQGIDRAGKLDEQAVAGRVGDPAVVLVDLWVNYAVTVIA
jgi:hypothetical protein